MAQKSLQRKKGIGCLTVALIVIFIPVVLLGGFIFFATADLRRSDEDILKTYQPSPEIAEIAEKNTLTDHGKATLYRTEPLLVDAKSYVKFCQTIARGIEPLACNAPKPGGGPFGGREIFLLKIDDVRFADHKYAAAVHEMLHTAYGRLSSDEKKRLTPLLEQELSKHGDDTYLLSVLDTMKQRKNSQDDILNELHSKFGVEFSDLSVGLEDYYKQYFTNRQKVVELFQNGGFDSRARRMDEISYELKTLAPKLTSLQNQLTAYQNAGDMTSYNNLVGQFNSMVYQYNAKAAESQRIYAEIQQFYNYFKPGYTPPEKQKQ